MTQFAPALSSIEYLAVLILIGFIAEKTRFVPKLGAGISRLIINITLPVLVVISLSDRNIDEVSGAETLTLIIIAVAAISVLFAINALVGRLLRLPERKRVIHALAGSFGNVIFLAYPFIRQLFGEAAMFYAVIFSLVNDMLLYSVGTYLLIRQSHSDGVKWSVKYLINPNTISFAIGITLFLLRLRLPELLHAPLERLGSATVPLSMLFIGSVLATTKIREAFKDLSIWLMCFVKMLAVPLIFALGAHLLGLPKTASAGLMLSVATLQIAMPTQTSLSVLADRYRADTVYAAHIVFISTALSVVTLPLMYMVCTAVFTY